MTIEAMKQALEALESYHGYMEPLTTVFGGPRVPAEQSTTGKVEKAITSLRQAIADFEKQEPVAWATAIGKYAHVHWGKARPDYPVRYEIPLYTHPQPKREWVGLTEDERQDIIGRTPPRAYLNPNDWTSDMLVYIEAKLKEKNT